MIQYCIWTPIGLCSTFIHGCTYIAMCGRVFLVEGRTRPAWGMPERYKAKSGCRMRTPSCGASAYQRLAQWMLGRPIHLGEIDVPMWRYKYPKHKILCSFVEKTPCQSHQETPYPTPCHVNYIRNRNMWDPIKIYEATHVNSSPPPSPPSQYRIYASVNWSALVQIMACRIFGAKLLSKPTLGYYQLDS